MISICTQNKQEQAGKYNEKMMIVLLNEDIIIYVSALHDIVLKLLKSSKSG